MKLMKLWQTEDSNLYQAEVLLTGAEAAAILTGEPFDVAKTRVVEAFLKPASLASTSNGAAKQAATSPAKAAEKPAEKPKAAAAEKPATKPKAETKAAEKPAEKPALSLVGSDEDEPAVGDEPEVAAEDDDAPAFSLDGDVPEELMTAGRLLTVVSFLHGRGFHTVEAITAACNKLKDKVPLLKSNANFAERIPVAFAALPQA
jgi:hypothetical protein